MAEDREELLAHYRRMYGDMLAAVEGLTDELMVETSLDGWSVKDHLAHIAHWDELRAGEIERISAGHGSAWRFAEGQDEAYNAVIYKLRRNLSLAQVRWELERSHRRVLEAIDAATPRGLDASLYGEAGLPSRHQDVHTGWIRRWRESKGL